MAQPKVCAHGLFPVDLSFRQAYSRWLEVFMKRVEYSALSFAIIGGTDAVNILSDNAKSFGLVMGEW